jgi:glycerol uptake facilitator-like aquaporin
MVFWAQKRPSGRLYRPAATGSPSAVPTGSPYWQSFLLEFILTIFLMIVSAVVAKDTRAVGSMAGIAEIRRLMSVLSLQVLVSNFESEDVKFLNHENWERIQTLWQ